jgi:hypothetical protein
MDDDLNFSSFNLTDGTFIHCIVSDHSPQQNQPQTANVQHNQRQVNPQLETLVGPRTLYAIITIALASFWILYYMHGDTYFSLLSVAMLSVLTVLFGLHMINFSARR